MAIREVKALLNGSYVTLALNSGSGKYEGTVNAPNQTSYNQPGGVYVVTVEAVNTAGTKGTGSANLAVRETLAPVIAVTAPTAGAYLATNQPEIVFTVLDEAGGSGVDEGTIALQLDGAALACTKTAITNGYRCTATPAVLADGPHTITVDAKDHDGNGATRQTVAFTVDTIPPVLELSSPADQLITATAACTVAGTTNDATSGLATVSIQLNGADQGAVSVAADGSFSKALTLAEGSNTIVVTATDRAGKVTAITRTVLLDTTVPQITGIEITPDPATAGELVTIRVTVK